MPNSCMNWLWSLNLRTVRLNSIQPSRSQSKQGKFGGRRLARAINFEPKGENGYDPLFLVGETGKSSAD